MATPSPQRRARGRRQANGETVFDQIGYFLNIQLTPTTAIAAMMIHITHMLLFESGFLGDAIAGGGAKSVTGVSLLPS